MQCVVGTLQNVVKSNVPKKKKSILLIIVCNLGNVEK